MTPILTSKEPHPAVLFGSEVIVDNVSDIILGVSVQQVLLTIIRADGHTQVELQPAA